MDFSLVSVATKNDCLHKEVLENLYELFPDPIVIRSQVTKQSKGLISSRTLANYDCSAEGQGVPNRFLLNGKVCYDREVFVQWLANRITLMQVKAKKDRVGCSIDELLQK